MKSAKNKMEEAILVCVYYGPNGERLITRGSKLSKMMDCPLYILTVDSKPFDEFDAEKSMYISKWMELAEQHQPGSFILRDNEKKPVSKVISEVAREKGITQIILGQTAQSRLEQIAKGSIINTLLREIPFVDLHIISVSRSLKHEEGHYEKGVRAYLIEKDDHYRLVFNYSKDVVYEGIFFKEFGTDFDNGVFKFMKGQKTLHVQVTEGIIKDLTNIDIDKTFPNERD